MITPRLPSPSSSTWPRTTSRWTSTTTTTTTWFFSYPPSSRAHTSPDRPGRSTRGCGRGWSSPRRIIQEAAPVLLRPKNHRDAEQPRLKSRTWSREYRLSGDVKFSWCLRAAISHRENGGLAIPYSDPLAPFARIFFGCDKATNLSDRRVVEHCHSRELDPWELSLNCMAKFNRCKGVHASVHQWHILSNRRFAFLDETGHCLEHNRPHID